mgnify:CR=1 FL=1
MTALSKIRENFPVLSKHIYLNTPASGLLPASVLKWRQKHDVDFFEGGSFFRAQHDAHFESIRLQVAQFFNATTQEVVLTPNFSIGCNFFAEGFTHLKKVLVLENDYPSLWWPFVKRGFQVVKVPQVEEVEAAIFEACSKNKPAIFIFSKTQYLNGLTLSEDFLKQLKVAFPEMLLFADGTQFLGTTKFNFKDSAIDCIGCSAYKWLLAGYGNGFYLVKPEVSKLCAPKVVGYNSATTFAMPLDEVPFQNQFEPGHLDTLVFGTLAESIKYLEVVGMSFISTQIEKIMTFIVPKLVALDVLEASVLERKVHGSILNLSGGADLFTYLQAQNIVAAPRGNGIRVGFHFYNTLEEAAQLCDAIASYNNTTR